MDAGKRYEAELRTVFDFFDKDHSGSIPLQDALSMLRSMGEIVSEVDLSLVCPSGTLTLQQFLQHERERFAHPTVSYSELLCALRCLEREGAAGRVSVEELTAALASEGEAFTQDEVAQFLKDCGADRHGYIDSAALATKLAPIK